MKKKFKIYQFNTRVKNRLFIKRVVLGITALGCYAHANDNCCIFPVTTTAKSEEMTINNIGKNELKFGNLAEALATKVPTISIVRRSGIANDIILRGQKKDNINVLIDGAKMYGACPNRMDPPVSHVNTNNIENIEIVEGPYDVENFGTLSGLVAIDTKKPSSKLNGILNLNMGSFGYKKTALAASAGSDKIKVLISVSQEESEQYKDGNGDTLTEQTASASALSQYQDKYKDMRSYEKKTLMAKVFVDLMDNHDLKIGYAQNNSNETLFSSSPMDALHDNANLLNIDYSIKNLSKYSKSLDFEYYNSAVYHPMSTKYRKSAVEMMGDGEIENSLTTDANGIKIKNRFNYNKNDITIGLDSNYRNWEGDYYNDGVKLNRNSIPDTDTKNSAVFAKINHQFEKSTIKIGLRYDTTNITPKSSQDETTYTSLNGNILTVFTTDSMNKFFVGIGKSSRVPDARELYYYSYAVDEVGNPNLKQTENYGIDFGFEKKFGYAKLETKLFYSYLKDYIYKNADKTTNTFENIDATIYGFNVNGKYIVSNDLLLDFGVVNQRGQKMDALDGQTDKDLAEINPMKFFLIANYSYDSKTDADVSLITSDSWRDFDKDNSEQKVDGYSVVNIKAKREFFDNFDLTIGIDNIFDEAYAVSNTYSDLTLVSGNEKRMLLNEPGRYFFINMDYMLN